MNSNPLVSVVIPTHNRKEKLFSLIKSIFRSNYPSDKLEIIVVDDASSDGTCDMVKKFYPEVKVIRIDNEVFPAKARDIGARRSRGDYIFFIDDDCIVHPDTIAYLIKTAMIKNKVGIIAPIILYKKEMHKIWCAGCVYEHNRLRDLIHLYKDSNLREVQEKHKILSITYSPSAFLIRKSIYLEVDGFNYKDFPIAWEEVDLALRVKQRGYQNICVTKAVVIHDVEPNFRARNPTRAYYQGRSRTIFYRNYFKKKIVLMPAYVLGFFIENKSITMTLKYLCGVRDGITWK